MSEAVMYGRTARRAADKPHLAKAVNVDAANTTRAKREEEALACGTVSRGERGNGRRATSPDETAEDNYAAGDVGLLKSVREEKGMANRSWSIARVCRVARTKGQVSEGQTRRKENDAVQRNLIKT